jgi:hypothetical protein
MNKRLPSAQTIKSFWDWFLTHEQELRNKLVDSDMQEFSGQIGPRVLDLSHDLGWEIGPGLKKSFSLALALNGNLANVSIAEQVVSQAPPVENWEFHAGRPPKEWDFKFVMTNQRGQRVNLDASNWHYLLVGFKNYSFFDITIVAHNLPRMDDTARRQAANIVLQSILGERMVLELFDDIMIMATIGKEERERMSNITLLSQHMSDLLRNHSS